MSCVLVLFGTKMRIKLLALEKNQLKKFGQDSSRVIRLRETRENIYHCQQKEFCPVSWLNKLELHLVKNYIKINHDPFDPFVNLLVNEEKF